ncbi:PilT domain-containing protein [Myxococcus stipitatus DSM 14675]|uniref:PilT domain-containing protein n=1 Tax=Myxococcus stipitatus (strain DSM 14675 / JCM 12634 / Mx s8) TaxID=1278073 RepID=L7U7B8_MYXSD|nr:PIN domain-containing protein [Myxococcus stipitatus]AGC43978.1 PilT domain-containing protein [Myxococcus stipitatus DSM 14675]
MTPALPPLSVVLDTNVVLDLYVFEDPATRVLWEALEAGRVVAWVEEGMLAELGFVLASRNFLPGRQVDARRTALERYRARARLLREGEGAPVVELPRCKDRDDQRFLVLAARARVDWLVSKDKRVLSMADRRELPFTILTLRQAVARLEASRG